MASLASCPDKSILEQLLLLFLRCLLVFLLAMLLGRFIGCDSTGKGKESRPNTLKRDRPVPVNNIEVIELVVEKKVGTEDKTFILRVLKKNDVCPYAGRLMGDDDNWAPF